VIFLEIKSYLMTIQRVKCIDMTIVLETSMNLITRRLRQKFTSQKR